MNERIGIILERTEINISERTGINMIERIRINSQSAKFLKIHLEME